MKKEETEYKIEKNRKEKIPLNGKIYRQNWIKI